MKLTKLQALILCEKIWRWLAENPTRKKQEWIGWGELHPSEIYDGNGRYKGFTVRNYCFACAYALQETIKYKFSGGTCANCPLRKLWRVACYMEPSPYVRWINSSNINTRRKNALKIADFCKKEIASIRKAKKR